jgi:hypothetical protein
MLISFCMIPSTMEKSVSVEKNTFAHNNYCFFHRKSVEYV